MDDRLPLIGEAAAAHCCSGWRRGGDGERLTRGLIGHGAATIGCPSRWQAARWRRAGPPDVAADSMGIGMSWTDERIEKLMKMWEGGATASQIADELGGVSRNAVIGKAHRLGLKARPSPVKPNERPDAQPAQPRRTGPASDATSAPEPAAKGSEPPMPRPEPASGPIAPAEPPVAVPAETPGPPPPRIVSVGARRLPAPGSGRTAGADPAGRRRAAWSRPSRAPRSPARPACSISATASAGGRWDTRASPTSTSAATR